MRRVLLTCDAVGGVWRYSLDLALGLRARGIAASLAVLGPPPSAPQLEEAGGLEVVSTLLPLDWTAPDPDALRAAGAQLAGLAKRLRVDSVHLHAPALAAETAWSVPVVAVAHSDVGTWWDAVRGGPLPDDLAWRAEATARGLAEADVVIAPTRAFANHLKRRYRPGRPIEVVHNGTRMPDHAPASRHVSVLLAGRLWDEGKNVALLDRAAADFDVPFVAAGAVAAPHGETAAFDHLHHLGLLGADELAGEMQRRTVFVSASRYEPFGLAVLEAASCGMALALSDIGSHRELWESAALFFHPQDEAGVRDVLRRLIASPESMARRACERAATYSLDAMVTRTLALHRALIAERREQPCAS